jgi:hypothetical protein
MPHCVEHFSVSALFLTIVFIVDSTVADLAAIATCFPTSMKNISQPQTEVQLLASVFQSKFLNKANSDLIRVEFGGHWVTVKNYNHKEVVNKTVCQFNSQ